MTQNRRLEQPPGIKQSTLTIGLSVAVIALFAVSIGAGQAALPLVQSVAELWRDDPTIAALILGEIRLPRAILAVLIGASLGLSGAALQGLLRNPLADPGIIGVSNTAALGVVLVLYFGVSQFAAWTLPAAGMIGAGVAVVGILMLAGRGSSVLTVILAGVAVNAFAGALTTLTINLAPSPFAVVEIVLAADRSRTTVSAVLPRVWPSTRWSLLGSLADRSFDHVWLGLPFTIVGWVLLFTTRRALDAITLSEDTATSLGFRLDQVRLRVVIGAACCVGAGVAVAGAIGFVGLVVPHLLRPLVGHEPGRLLLPSVLGGALLLLAADTAIRLTTTGAELKLGVVTALIGAPFFLRLIVRSRQMVT